MYSKNLYRSVLFVFIAIALRISGIRCGCPGGCPYAEEPLDDNLVYHRDDIYGTVSRQQDDTVMGTEKFMRLEQIKATILSKLGLDEPPKINKRAVDEVKYNAILEARMDQQLNPPAPVDESDQVYIFPIKSNRNAFNLSLGRLNKPFKKVILSLKKASGAYDIYEDDPGVTILQERTAFNTTFQRILDKVSPIGQYQRWRYYDLTELMANYPDENENIIIIDAERLSATSTPFITIQLSSSGASNRRKRSDKDCHRPNQKCCRDSLYVNFTEISWDWIIQPPGYWAYYCRGACGIDDTLWTHGMALQAHRKSGSIKLCCGAKSTSSLTVLYMPYANDHSVIKTTLDHMVVEECACA